MSKYIILILFYLSASSCNKLIEIENNDTFLEKDKILSNETYLISFMNSIYTDLNSLYNNSTNSMANIGILVGAFSDEYNMVFEPPIYLNIYKEAYLNKYYEANIDRNYFFDVFYKLIVRVNNAIDMLDDINTNEFMEYHNELRGIRSILYYYLAQFYDELPLLISSDIDINLQEKRKSNIEILSFVKSELEEIYILIDDEKKYLSNKNNSVRFTERINKTVVGYFLSLVYLTTKDYDKSIELSKVIISKFEFENQYENKFKLSSNENIWVLFPAYYFDTGENNNPSFSALNFNLTLSMTPFNSSRLYSLSSQMINSMSINDKRRKYFIDSVFYNNEWKYLPNKYKTKGSFNLDIDERLILIRLVTVYYNLMEALYLNGEEDEALYYFNLINDLNYEDYISVNELTLNDIINERRNEMFGELGDRWITLKRTNLIDSVMEIYLPIKNNNSENWNASLMRSLPIPLNATLNNPIL